MYLLTGVSIIYILVFGILYEVILLIFKSEYRDKFKENWQQIWNIIKWANTQKYHRFDFGGGGVVGEPYGPREFKRRFGGVEFQYNNLIYTHGALRHRMMSWYKKRVKKV